MVWSLPVQQAETTTGGSLCELSKHFGLGVSSLAEPWEPWAEPSMVIQSSNLVSLSDTLKYRFTILTT